MNEPRPFRIDIPDSRLADLRNRLERTRWQEPLAGSGWDFGSDQDYIQQLCTYWADGYDWRVAERRLNSYEQVLVPVDGIELHAVHVRSPDTSSRPLMLVHGWPGSIWEFMGLIEQLPDLHLVVPSLPGFGFSGKPRERGWNITRTAAAFDALMGALGYSSYAAQGGDWGGVIATQLAVDFPDRCHAIHLNQASVPLPATMPDDLRQWKADFDRYLRRESAYRHIQETRPDSLTLALNDSPAGLAAWIIEKFRGWGQTDGDIESVFTKDDLITNLMVYWLTGSAGSAARIYREFRYDPAARALAPVRVPTAIAAFPGEPFGFPRQLVERRYLDLRRWTDMPAGGHFAAMEQPALLAHDIRDFFASL